ncbi:related to acid proteinase PEPI precursor [Rhynchosporium secalis]|uniref:Probable aspartic-type endopeptidase OPSB n=1 Tax=Rhynchosporium secalis TaxID=38038 RepID=A0A1E1M5V0_RHYSE|nr:related to acid proteinase PEPI precursor [Rhynchosporium secalis]
MALLSTLALLLSLPLTLATVQFDIVRSPSVQTAQLQQRQAHLRARALGLDSHILTERADTVTADLTNARLQGLYFANVTVGTPGQQLALQIDTGSSDVWVAAAEAALCGNAREGGCPNGQFDYKKSSTFLDVGKNDFNISYVDGSGAVGDYFQDTFTIGGATLSQFQMGIALDTTIGTGIMGIGYNTSEANIDTGNGTVYPNLPLALVNQGLVKTTAYSLWLNDLESSTGSILFGGVDTAKYTGDLISVKVYPSSRRGRITSFTVAFTSMSATSPSGTDQLTPKDYAVAAILDSGTTITLLPDDVAAAVFEELGATVNNQVGAVIVPCDLAKVDGTLNYGFGGQGGPVIKVQVSDLVLPLIFANGRQPKYTNGQAACQLGIQAAGDLPVLFGDTFLRSAYAVYDLANNQIALAQTDFNSTDSNVVSFASAGAAIPNAVQASGNAAVTQTATGAPRVSGGSATGTGNVAPTYNPQATGLNAASGFAATAKPSSTGKKNAGGAGPEPFAWSRIVVGVVSLGMMGLGGGFLALL